MTNEDNKLAVWHRVDQELVRRRKAHMPIGEWADIGRELSLSKQQLHNWKTRGVPKPLYPDIAALLGWTVDQLLGLADTPRPATSAVVSEHQRIFSAIPEHQQEEVHAYMLRLLMNVTPGVAQKVARKEPSRGQHIGGIDTGFSDLSDDDQKKASGGKR